MEQVSESGDLNVSSISVVLESTVREQPSMLELNGDACLHSTFNYPLHSTLNHEDYLTVVTIRSSTSDTLTKVAAEKQIMQCSADVSSHQLLSERSSAFQEDLDHINCNADSDDSSYLSFDVDHTEEMYGSLKTSSHSAWQPHHGNSYLNNIIHKQVGLQMWGDQYQAQTCHLSSTQCDVCELLKLRRQRGCTDLWSESSSMQESTTITSLSSVGSFKSCHQSTQFCDKHLKKCDQGKSGYKSTPCRRYSEKVTELSSPCVLKSTKRKRRSLQNPQIQREDIFQHGSCFPSTRLRGTTNSNLENVLKDDSNISNNCYSEQTENRNVLKKSRRLTIGGEGISGSSEDKLSLKKSKKHKPSLVVSSPWNGDKDLVKRRFKYRNHQLLHSEDNIITLGVF